MTKQEFKNLTGEDPEDVLGADWENELTRDDICNICGKKFLLDEDDDWINHKHKLI